MDDGEDDDIITGLDFVEDPVGVSRNLADVVVAELGDDAAEPRQLGERVGLLETFLA